MQQAALPIYKAALEMAVYMELIVRHFDRYHKYTVGTDLRQKSKGVLYGISRAHLATEKLPALIELRDRCEEMKMLIQITKELKAFKNFKQFEHSSLLAVTVCKQAQAWLNAAKKSRGEGMCIIVSVRGISADRSTNGMLIPPRTITGRRRRMPITMTMRGTSTSTVATRTTTIRTTAITSVASGQESKTMGQ